MCSTPTWWQDKAGSGPTRSSQSNMGGMVQSQEDGLQCRMQSEHTKRPASNNRNLQRREIKFPLRHQAMYLEKGTSETRRWVWDPQVEMEMRCSRWGEVGEKAQGKKGVCPAWSLMWLKQGHMWENSLLRRSWDIEGASWGPWVSFPS